MESSSFFRRKSRTFFCVFFILLLGIVFFGIYRYIHSHQEKLTQIPPTQASYFDFGTNKNGDNLTGFAWSENAGWISFNSITCDVNHNGQYEGSAEGAPAGCPTSGTAIDYGVHVDPATGIFSGYAWSENIGWIWFAPTGPYPLDPSDTSFDLGQHSARYEYDGDATQPMKYVTGWARICALTDNTGTCSGGDRGWIKMSGKTADSTSYGVKMSMADDSSIGYAWNAEDDGTGVGWISFNSKNCDTNGNNTFEGSAEGAPAACPVSGTAVPYGVVAQLNAPPVIKPADKKAVTDADACAEPNGSVKNAHLRWKFTDPNLGSFEGAYHVTFEDSSHNVLFDSGKCTTPSANCLISSKVFNNHDADFPIYQKVALAYGATYYWHVTVWDEYDKPAILDYSDSFTIATHEAPDPLFTWFTASPSQGEEVLFQSKSICYSGDFTTGYPCPDAPAVTYNWSLEYEDLVPTPACAIPNPGTIKSPTASSTIITFNCHGTNNRVHLIVGDGYNCEYVTPKQSINVNIKLPTWVESR